MPVQVNVTATLRNLVGAKSVEASGHQECVMLSRAAFVILSEAKDLIPREEPGQLSGAIPLSLGERG